MHKYKVGAFYGGYGASLLGAEWAGFDPAFLCEPRPEFEVINTLENFPNLKIFSTPHHGELKEADLIWGSPPCAQFSTLGVDYYRFLRAMEYNQIPVFVLENVPRVLKFFTFEDGYVLFNGIRCLEMSNYNFQVVELDANLCGVPQKRKRAYVIGSRVFEPNYEVDLKYGSKIINRGRYRGSRYVGEVVSDVLPIDHTQSELPNHSEMRRKGFSGLEPGQSYYGTQNNRRLFWDKPSLTITSHCTRHVHPQESRVLSVKECAKLMGYPDDFKFSGSERQKLDQIGKAIVPQVAYLISNYINYELQRINHKSRYL